MAIWHFRFNLLPKIAMIQKNEAFPKYLPEYKSNFNLIDSLQDDYFTNYWEGYDLKQLVKQFEEYLPTLEPWDENLSVFGYEDGCKIEVTENEVYIKFDSRSPDYSFLDNIITIASNSNLLIVLEEDGQVILPDMNQVLWHLKKSRAFRFCQNPEQVLSEIAILIDKKGRDN